MARFMLELYDRGLMTGRNLRPDLLTLHYTSLGQR